MYFACQFFAFCVADYTELSNVVIGAYQQKLAELQNSASQRDSEPPEQDEDYTNEMF